MSTLNKTIQTHLEVNVEIERHLPHYTDINDSSSNVNFRDLIFQADHISNPNNAPSLSPYSHSKPILEDGRHIFKDGTFEPV